MEITDVLGGGACLFIGLAIGIFLGAYLERPKRDDKGRFTK